MNTIFIAAVDGSEGAIRAAEFAAERAQREGAKLLLLHVVHWSRYEGLAPEELETRHADKEREVRRAHDEILDPLAERLRNAKEGLAIETVVHHGHQAETISRAALDLKATQVFAGRRGMSALKAMIFGSVSGTLVQMCPVPLTVVP